MYIISKCTLGHIKLKICSPLPLNKTAQPNSQYWTKLHNEGHNVLLNKIY